MRRSIEIVNKTKHSTKSLRAIFTLVHADFLKLHAHPKRLRVYVGRARHHVHGFAYLNSGAIDLFLPSKPDLQTVAWVFYHELLHCDGLEHKDMPDRKLSHKDFSYVDHLTIEPEQPKRKLSKTVDTKITALKARRRRWLTKMIRAHRAIRKIDRSLKYYAKKGAQTHEAHKHHGLEG